MSSFLLLRKAVGSRDQLKTAAKRIVVKVGSAIITHDRGHLSAPRLASIVEQIAFLQQQGRQMLLVSSGAVAFGRRKIHDEVQKSKSIRETISEKPRARPLAENRAAAAVGQSSLMSFYEILFQQYDCKVAQVLVTKADFHNESSRSQLRNTILDLLSLNIVPIVNTNDAVEATVTHGLTNGGLDLKKADMTDIIVEDNDSLAAILAVELESDLMIMLSNVDGIYSGPPDKKDSRFFPTFTPQQNSDNRIEFGSKSNVGLGGMQAKIKSALWALKRGTSVVICNGSSSGAITGVVHGDRVGTFFTENSSETESSQLAIMARNGSASLKSIGAEARSQIILEIAQELDVQREAILAENERDVVKAKAEKIEDALLNRLKLTDAKLNSLIDGLKTISEKSLNQIDRTIKLTKISDTITLRQVTCPIGVLLVIFESRPDCLPQISALSIATANGLLLKGGKEAHYSNLYLYNLIRDILKKYNCHDAIQLVDSRERVNELASMDDHIDLIIPRGSNQLVRTIQQQAKTTPVLGHAEGICHVYIDKDANEDEAIRIAVDSKCDYPAACNAMETLLIHRSLVNTSLFARLCNEMKERNVKLNIGPRLAKELPFYQSTSTNYRVEYGSLECTLEIVDSVDDAIHHINRFGSGHTDAIVTKNETNAREFKKHVESASVFVNASTRFADGYRFGLGAEVGISTSKLHARGPAGLESLTTYKWLLEGSGDTVTDYENGGSKKYTHEDIDSDKYYQAALFPLVIIWFGFYAIWLYSKPSTESNSNAVQRQPTNLSDLELSFYNSLPLRTTSSLWGKLNSYELPVFMRSRLYDFFCRTYQCDMSEALEADYRNYRNLSEFFNRRLRPDSRPISPEPGVVSPADGLVVHCKPMVDSRVENVKGLNYSVQAFLGLPSDDYEKELIVDKENNELYNCIIYLAPGDYHRFHSPANWLVKYRKHFPGRLLSVRPSLMKRMPEILHINERVCYAGRWAHGFFSMTAVGATNVGSIKVHFDEDLKTNRRHLWRPDRYACFEHKFDKELALETGQDFGEFNFGSTIVLIFEAPKNSTFDVKANQKIKYGQLMARIE